MAHVIKVERATKDGKKRHAWKVRYRDPDRVEKARTFTKKTDAEKFASTVETDILRGDYVDPRAGKVALEDWSKKWAAGLSVKPKTKSGYESLLRSRILPTFGKRRLAELRRRISRSGSRRCLPKVCRQVVPAKPSSSFVSCSTLP